MIFSVPATKNGTFLKAGRANSRPAKYGAIAAPVVRATPVIPAAADLSSGPTTAITYDWRVGTSIWEMLKRRSNTMIAERRFGMSGTNINNTFEGR